METRKILAILVLGLMVCQAKVSEAGPMGTAFTYQGHLYDANHVADGLYDFQFKLYDANVGTGQVGSDVNKPDVDVIDALFTVELDFGSSVFNGNAVWLEIGVRPGEMNDPNVYTTLSPRLEVTPTPYALQTRGIFVDDNGDVGIGTTSPSGKLHVYEYQGYAPAYAGYFNATGHEFGGNAYALYADASADDENAYGIYATAASGYSTAYAGYFDAGDVVVANGDVGIGITTPSEKLDVVGNTQISGRAAIGTTIENFKGLNVYKYGGYNPAYAGYFNAVGHEFSGVAYALYADASADDESAYGIYATASSVSGTAYAGYFDAGDVVVANGDVGIGTTNPSRKLEVSSLGATFGRIASTGSSDAGIEFFRAGTGFFDWRIYDTGGDLRFAWSGDDFSTFNIAMTIKPTSGNVGIGTMSPVEKLHVAGDIRLDAGGDIAFGDDNTRIHENSDDLFLEADDDIQITPDDDILMDVSTLVVDGSANSVGIGDTLPDAKLDVLNTGTGASFRVDDSFDDDASPFIIDSSGNVGIGTLSPLGKLDIRGDEVRIWDGSATIDVAMSQGDLYVENDLEVDDRVYMIDVYQVGVVGGRDVHVASNGRLSFNASSKRYKENIKPLKDDFSKILKAQPVTFTSKQTKERGIGFIAEDFDELGLRKLVFYDTEGKPDGIHYDTVCLYLLEVLKGQVETTKQLKAKNESLKKQLEAQNQSLRQRLETLESTMRQYQLAMGKDVQQ